MRCYFHLASDLTFISDDVGIEVAESRQAMDRALLDVLELLYQAPESGDWRGWQLKVADAGGKVLFQVTLGPLAAPLSQTGCGSPTPPASLCPSGASSETDTEERRLTPREQTFARGRVTFKHRQGGCDCIIEDISERGARLRFPEGTALPETVSIYLAQIDRTVEAKVRWTTSDRAGVEFIAGDANVVGLGASEKAAKTA